MKSLKADTLDSSSKSGSAKFGGWDDNEKRVGDMEGNGR